MGLSFTVGERVRFQMRTNMLFQIAWVNREKVTLFAFVCFSLCLFSNQLLNVSDNGVFILANFFWLCYCTLHLVCVEFNFYFRSNHLFWCGTKKWEVTLAEPDPWCELIWHQVEQRSSSWYSFKYWLVLGGTGSAEGSTGWYLESLGQY